MDPKLRRCLEAVVGTAFSGRGFLVAYAFGSRVSGRPRRDSDLDVGYYLLGYREGEKLPLREELLLAADLSEAVGVEVDLRDLADAPLELRGRALEEGVRIYSGDEAARVALEVSVLSRYHDAKEGLQRTHDLRLAKTAATGL